MSLLSRLFPSLDGKDNKSTVTQRPCSNCPGDCTIAGEACEVCEPYKRKLIDILYYIDHLEEFLAKYEVADLAGEQVVNCPYCGARSSDPHVCEYCGSRLKDGTGKTRVEKASDIPNPIMQAQDIIFERADCVIKQYTKSASSSQGILSELLAAVSGQDSDSEGNNPLGAKMSETEIKEAAALYGVSVSAYLTGLDNGKYLTLAGKKALDSGAYSNASATVVPGIAGIGAMAGALLGEKQQAHRPPKPPADGFSPSRAEGKRQISDRGEPPKQRFDPQQGPGRGPGGPVGWGGNRRSGRSGGPDGREPR